MSPRLPSCPSWCRGAHSKPGAPCIANVDLVEHLDNSDCLFEVNVTVLGDDQFVEVRFTDLDGTNSAVKLSRESAGTIGRIIELFDRRGLREFGQMLAEGAVMLAEVEQ